MENEFDKLHKQIGADKLNKKEQKKLFDKFIDHGGKIIKPPVKKTKVKDSKHIIGGSEKRKLKELAGEENKEEQKSEDRVPVIAHNSFFDKLALYLASTFVGVKTIFGDQFKETFINEQKTLLNTELYYLDNVIKFILNPKKAKYKTFITLMIKKNIYLYELLRISSHLYNAEDVKHFSKIAENSIGNIDFIAIEEPIKKIYRRLYLFRHYYSELIDAVELALSIKKDLKLIDDQSYKDYMAKSKKAIDIIYHNCLHKLHYAISNLFMEHIYIQDQSRIYGLLHIHEGETVEYRIKQAIKERKKTKTNKQKSLSTNKNDEEKLKEKKQEELPESLKEGKEWIDKLDYTNETVKDKGNIAYFNKNDKIFKVYVILEEFEKEFSFILTSNKIKFNIDLLDGKKVDTKKEFSDLYLGINSCHDLIKDYTTILKEINDIEINSSLSTYKKNEMLLTFEDNQTRISNIIRVRLTDITKKLEKILSWINNSDSVTQNSSEKLYFDTIDGKKRLEGTNSSQAISYCYSFIAYFRYLLTEGELYGASPQIITDK